MRDGRVYDLEAILNGAQRKIEELEEKLEEYDTLQITVFKFAIENELEVILTDEGAMTVRNDSNNCILIADHGNFYFEDYFEIEDYAEIETQVELWERLKSWI